MVTRRQISERRLKRAFSLAEDRLRLKGEENRAVAKKATDETQRRMIWEDAVRFVIVGAFRDTFPSLTVKMEVGRRKKIDVCVVNKGDVIVAIECKGMVSDSHTKSPPVSATSVGGINRKLNEAVQADIDGIDEKLKGTGAVGSHYEIFIPIVYELYRQGGKDEWHVQERPWTTHPGYKNVRKNLKHELEQWFEERDKQFKLIHGTDEPVELWDANRLWSKTRRLGAKYRKYKSLEAYVNFFAFGRYVEA